MKGLTLYKQVRLLALLVIGVLLAGCSGGESSVTVTVTEGAQEDSTATAESDPAEADDEEEGPATPIRLGKTGEDGSLAISVHGIHLHDTVDAEYPFDGETIEPRDGAYLVKVNATWTNNGKSAIWPCSTSTIVLIDEEERNFTPADDTYKITGDDCNETQPGFKATGAILFEVPDDASITGVAMWDDSEPDDYDGSKSYLSFKGKIEDFRAPAS